MKKTIAIIASLDTKGENVLYIKNLIEDWGHKTYIIDIGSNRQNLVEPNINALEVARAAGYNWAYPINVTRRELIDVMKKGVKALIPDLYKHGLFDAIISIGGLQNTTVAVSAMKELPLGVPKVMVSTMASGKRPFNLIVGYSDIIPIHSLADFSGDNIVTNNVLKNAVAAIIGMVEKAGVPLVFTEDKVVGITAMGVVNRGAEGVIKKLKEKRFHVVSFHSTGVGGKIMDNLIKEGVIKATVELSLHEIVGELFGGYASGANDRLVSSAEKGIPQIIVPGGCDFIDMEGSGLDKKWFERKHIYHNADIIHFKLLKNEALEVGKLIALRLNKSKGTVRVVIPLQGFREGAKKGEPLYDPDVDKALIDTLKNNLRDDIKIIEVDANINDDFFVSKVTEEALKVLMPIL